MRGGGRGDQRVGGSESPVPGAPSTGEKPSVVRGDPSVDGEHCEAALDESEGSEPTWSLGLVRNQHAMMKAAERDRRDSCLGGRFLEWDVVTARKRDHERRIE